MDRLEPEDVVVTLQSLSVNDAMRRSSSKFYRGLLPSASTRPHERGIVAT